MTYRTPFPLTVGPRLTLDRALCDPLLETFNQFFYRLESVPCLFFAYPNWLWLVFCKEIETRCEAGRDTRGPESSRERGRLPAHGVRDNKRGDKTVDQRPRVYCCEAPRRRVQGPSGTVCGRRTRHFSPCTTRLPPISLARRWHHRSDDLYLRRVLHR
jgi:hypothetical protein